MLTKSARLFLGSGLTGLLLGLGAIGSSAAVKNPPKAKASIAGFCKASKAWVDWETVTLPTAGHLDKQWVVDTISFVNRVYLAAPKEIKTAARVTSGILVSTRIKIVSAATGQADIPEQVAELIQFGEGLSGGSNSVVRPDFVQQRDKFAAYMLAKCKVDFTAPFKSFAEKADGNH